MRSRQQRVDSRERSSLVVRNGGNGSCISDSRAFESGVSGALEKARCGNCALLMSKGLSTAFCSSAVHSGGS